MDHDKESGGDRSKSSGQQQRAHDGKVVVMTPSELSQYRQQWEAKMRAMSGGMVAAATDGTPAPKRFASLKRRNKDAAAAASDGGAGRGKGGKGGGGIGGGRSAGGKGGGGRGRGDSSVPRPDPNRPTKPYITRYMRAPEHILRRVHMRFACGSECATNVIVLNACGPTIKGSGWRKMRRNHAPSNGSLGYVQCKQKQRPRSAPRSVKQQRQQC